VLFRLSIDGVDQLQRAVGVAALVALRLDPDGKKLRAEVSGARGVEVQIAVAERGGEVILLVEETLRGVGVAVDGEY
jgi:hypothetical protein